MSKLTLTLKRAVLQFRSSGLSARQIAEKLASELSVHVSRQAICYFLLHYNRTKRLARRPGSGRPTKISQAVLNAVEAKMQCDDETTATQLQTLLERCGYNISLSTIRRARSLLGWTFHGSRYCQLIRSVNKEKRFVWAQMCLADQDEFSDETSIQLECYRRHCFRKANEQPRLKPRPKHPLKVHVWAAISKKGASTVCIFEGKMDAVFYVRILEEHLVPFIADKFPSTHRFMQDNDPKHTSRLSKQFFEENSINWWKTPPESPDCNPIENLWHELKEFIRREVKPRSKQELINGIAQFWRTLTAEKCCRYINHLVKVLPKVIEVQGEATGY